jgi:hypothetical protein
MCKQHQRRGRGQADRTPVAARRQLGKRRRLTRRDLGTHGLEAHDVRVRGVTARTLWA